MPNLGIWEILLLLLVLLLVFGPKRLPEMGRSLGRGMREFKDSVTGKDNDEDVEQIEVAPAPVTTAQAVAAPAQPVPATTPPAAAQPEPVAAPAPPAQSETERVSG
jgi:sec-independent protein translocase protein TatA